MKAASMESLALTGLSLNELLSCSCLSLLICVTGLIVLRGDDQSSAW